MTKKLTYIILAIVLGVPSVSAASSVTVSLIQGKTPSEAMEILAGQIDGLIGRVSVLEEAKIKTDQDINELRAGQGQTSAEVNQTQLEIERLRLENENLKIQAEMMTKNRECDNLARKLPDMRGQERWWSSTPTIVPFYHRTKDLLDGNVEALNLFEGRNRSKEIIALVYEDTKPLYQAYISACGK